MTTNIIRTAFAAALVTASLGIAGGANAGIEHRDTDKHSFQNTSSPAFSVRSWGTGQMTRVPSEKANVERTTSPASDRAGPGKHQLVIAPNLSRGQ